MQTGIAIPCLVLLVVKPPHVTEFTGTVYLLLLCSISLAIALQMLNVKALQYLEASVFAVLYNLRIIFATVLGIIFLGEQFVWLRALGGLCILLAIFIVRQKGKQSVWTKGVEWGITAALVISLLSVVEKELIKQVGFMAYFSLEQGIAAVIMWAYLLRRNRDFEWSILAQPRMVQLMSLRALSAFGFSGALAAGAMVGVASYISGLNVIFMVILGAIWLDEKDYMKRKIWAAAVAVLGLTFIFFSRI
jgi:drug/metabolite transporter (DMT)-like permease